MTGSIERLSGAPPRTAAGRLPTINRTDKGDRLVPSAPPERAGAMIRRADADSAEAP